MLFKRNKNFYKTVRYYFPGRYNYNISYAVSSGTTKSCYGNFSYAEINATSDIRTENETYNSGDIVNLYASTSDPVVIPVCQEYCTEWGYT